VAQDVLGFFVDARQKNESGKVIFAEASSVHPLPRRDFSDVELEVIDFRSQVVGRYYIGRVWVGSLQASSQGGGLVDVEASFYGYGSPYPNAGTIWRRWASKKPLGHDEWLHYPVDFHASWLHVVQNSWFESGREVVERSIESPLSVDGDKMPSVASFYCAFGEAANGIGGYFGSNLDGFADCLSFGRAAGMPSEVLWVNSSSSLTLLGQEFVDSVASVLREFDIEVILC
jgi:RNAse (barnase) inhibitor barstar